MDNRRKILFIGSFLSARKGTKDVAEKVSELLDNSKYDFALSSKHQNKLLRILDIFLTIILSKSKVVFVDVFSGQAFLISRVAMFASKLRQKKTILILRGGGLADFEDKNKEICFKVLSKADTILTPSLFLQDHFMKRGLKIDYLPNPINLSKFTFKERNVIGKRLLWVRAFGKVYNPDVPVRILSIIKNEFPDSTLTLVGPDIGLLNETKQLAIDLNLMDSINFVGPVNNSDLPILYQSHDVYLNTPTFESFGVAVLEAAASGIPIVSFAVGEIPYLWKNQENMLLAPHGEIQLMAEKVGLLFNDKILYEKISFNAKANVERFSWDKIRPFWEINLEKYT